MFLQDRKGIAIAAGVLLLAGIGTAAWVHQSGRQQAPPPVAVIDSSTQPVATNYAPAPYPTAPYPTTQVTDADGYYASTERPVYIRQGQPEPPPVVEEQPQVQTQYVETYGGRRYVRHHGRSKKHSIEIVAGTAAAGAVIGAIAGGGPGAAIGAASGAGAGFVYDRLTHNH